MANTPLFLKSFTDDGDVTYYLEDPGIGKRVTIYDSESVDRDGIDIIDDVIDTVARFFGTTVEVEDE